MWNYNGLWKLLIDKNMTKEHLRQAIEVSPGTIAKMGKGERVKMEIIELICDYFQVRPAEIVDYEPKKFVLRKKSSSDAE